jgi:hypothetical protein
MRKEEVPALKERVKQIIAEPVEASLAQTVNGVAAPNPQTALED